MCGRETLPLPSHGTVARVHKFWFAAAGRNTVRSGVNVFGCDHARESQCRVSRHHVGVADDGGSGQLDFLTVDLGEYFRCPLDKIFVIDTREEGVGVVRGFEFLRGVPEDGGNTVVPNLEGLLTSVDEGWHVVLLQQHVLEAVLLAPVQAVEVELVAGFKWVRSHAEKHTTTGVRVS